MPGEPAFEDHFGEVASGYARFRPTYPESLYEWLASLAPRREAAWDCGTGTGQAALGLARHFARVLATDPSPEQVAHAASHRRIRYAVAAAEDSGLPDASVDLVTIAVALHWFDLPRFYDEVRRVARPGAAVVAWCYTLAHIDLGIDAVVEGYYNDVVGPYWPVERRYVEDGYASLPFPFAPLPHPSITMEARWNLPHLVGYLRTWSSSVIASRALGRDPLQDVMPALADAWGDPAAVRSVRWPLGIRAGRVSGIPSDP